MKITFKEKKEDPAYPILHGESPLAKEFNKRQADLNANAKVHKYDFEQVATVLLEIFAEDYNKRHIIRNKIKKEI